MAVLVKNYYIYPMKMQRIIKSNLVDLFNIGKAIVLIGARQTGKSTLIKEIIAEKGNYLFLDGDDFTIQQQLEQSNTEY